MHLQKWVCNRGRPYTEYKESYHIPVLLHEVLELLAIKADGTYVDCTLGGGGHFCAIVDRLGGNGTAIGIDRDRQAVEWVKGNIKAVKPRVLLKQARFSSLREVLSGFDVSSVDGIVLDCGVSSWQIERPERGFSYKSDVVLDMRMDATDSRTAEEVLNRSSERDLREYLKEFGEIRNPERMAAALVACRKERPFHTSSDLRACIEREYGSPVRFKVLAKLFQALRIVVNDELGELKACLQQTSACLHKGGRLAVIAYHSLEDRIVKQFIRGDDAGSVSGRNVSGFRRINKKVIRPAAPEITANPSSRSARLRVAERV